MLPWFFKIQLVKLLIFLAAQLLIPPALRQMQLLFVAVFLLLNCFVLILRNKLMKYAIFMIQILYICGQALNVFLIINELSNDHNYESLQFSLMYFGTSVMSDLAIYEILFSPSIAFPAFVYSPGYLIAILSYIILGG